MKDVNSSQQKKSRRMLLIVIAAFVLPIVLAKLALEQNWFNYGVTNNGTLIDNELTLSQLGLDSPEFEKSWLILYSLPSQCADHCEKALESVHNTYVALGREMPRVIPVALIQSPFTEQQQKRVGESKWQVMTMPSLAKNILENSQVYIVDPLGNVVLSHKIPSDVESLSSFGKQILADMKKLLKYSRVG